MLKNNLCKDAKIGLFDSGIGGISVLSELIKILPNEDFIYYGDSINSPYGDKNCDEIITFSIKIVDFLINNNCKIIVIACNTATAAAIEIIKKQFQVPIIGVINNGVKSAIKQTKSNNISVIGTTFTINSKIYIKEFNKVNNNLIIHQISCPKLCPMIENGWEGYEDRLDILKKYLDNIPENVDTLLLGCTHYPIIKHDIKKYFNKLIIDPAKETAKETRDTLKNMNLLNQNGLGRVLFCVNSDMNKVIKLTNLKNIFL